jgi:hypothetical protein
LGVGLGGAGAGSAAGAGVGGGSGVAAATRRLDLPSPLQPAALVLLPAVLIAPGAAARVLLRASRRRGSAAPPCGRLGLDRLARVLGGPRLGFGLLALELRDARLELADALLGGLGRERRRGPRVGAGPRETK